AVASSLVLPPWQLWQESWARSWTLRAKSRTGAVSSRPAVRWQRTQLVFSTGSGSSGFQPSGSLSGLAVAVFSFCSAGQQAGTRGAIVTAEPKYTAAAARAGTTQRIMNVRSFPTTGGDRVTSNYTARY